MKINYFEEGGENQVIVFIDENDWVMTTNGDPVYAWDADEVTSAQAAELWEDAHKATKEEIEEITSAGLRQFIDGGGENKMIKIKLTQEAYANSGTIRAGADSIYTLSQWYEATAEDADGNTYQVIWEVLDDYSPDDLDESYACDWDKPWAVIDDNGDDVADSVIVDR